MTQRLNPELQRYIWLEFSRHRLVAAPVVIALIFFLAWQSARPVESLSYVAKIVFMVMAGLWASHKAAESVTDEINENTWDFQRLSSLSPWELTWGKLFGSTLYCWYGGLMALAVYVGTSLMFMPAYNVLCNSLLLLGGALVCQGFALLSAMLALSSRRMAARAKMRAIGHQIIGVCTGLFVTAWMVEDHYMYSTNEERYGAIRAVQWYGESYGALGFVTVFTSIAVAWLLAGIYWQMRVQLRMRSGPWLWAAFVLFMMAVVSGFGRGPERLLGDAIVFPLAAFTTALALLYAMVFMEPWNGVTYRRWIHSWNSGRRADFLHGIPRWLATFVLTVLGALWVLVYNGHTIQAVYSMSILLAFVARDIALLHYSVLAPDTRRAVGATLFYLCVLYVLVPMLLSALRLDGLVPLFLPFSKGSQEGILPLSLISGLAQCAILAWLVRKRWQEYWR